MFSKNVTDLKEIYMSCTNFEKCDKFGLNLTKMLSYSWLTETEMKFYSQFVVQTTNKGRGKVVPELN
jgi:hypothetical protein